MRFSGSGSGFGMRRAAKRLLGAQVWTDQSIEQGMFRYGTSIPKVLSNHSKKFVSVPCDANGLGTIAESIESLALVPTFRLLRVRYGQGYALHQPDILDTAVLRGVVVASLVPVADGRRRKSSIL